MLSVLLRRSDVGRNPSVLAGFLCGFMLLSLAWGGDWPTYRRDAARSGATEEELSFPLSKGWTFRPGREPSPAWGKPNPREVGGWNHLVEGPRLRYDDVYHVTAADGAVYFGSSSQDRVCCLNLRTGGVKWTRLTTAPVRLAPTVRGGRVYFGCDDGYVRCLRASDGKEIWTFRAAPREDKLLGNGRMISRWPVRTNVLVQDGVAYFAAGVWPSEGIYVYAVDADTGKLRWCNDTAALRPQSSFTPRGYLVASKEMLFLPLGRRLPAALDRESGRVETTFGQHGAVEHRVGGTYAIFHRDLLITGTRQLLAFRPSEWGEERGRAAVLTASRMVAGGGTYYLITGRPEEPKWPLKSIAPSNTLVAVEGERYVDAARRRRVGWLEDRSLGGALDDAEGEQEGLKKRLKQKRERLEESREEISELESEGGEKRKLSKLREERKKLEKECGELEEKLKPVNEKVEKLRKKQDKLHERIDEARSEMSEAVKWKTGIECRDELVRAGGTLLVGGRGKVVAVRTEDGEKVWETEVDGKAGGLAVADGRVLVSTDRGDIHCFTAKGTEKAAVVRPDIQDNPYPDDGFARTVRSAARHIVRHTGVKKGYCLVLGCGDGRLALELARRTELRIYGVTEDAEKAREARRRMETAGLHGGRVTIEKVDDLSAVPYSDYFANLVVSQRALRKGGLPGSAGEAFRMLKPEGGVLHIGRPGGADEPRASELREWVADSPLEKGRMVEKGGSWLPYTRGGLPGAGAWTHQYADPGNTTCGDDTRIRAPLGILWYGRPGPRTMAERHRKGAAPLAGDGRFIVQGEGAGDEVGFPGDDVVKAYDAYNGTKLWERNIEGALRTHLERNPGNMALAPEGLLVAAAGGSCHRLDPATGKTLSTYEVPAGDTESTPDWRYVAVADGLLYGSRRTPSEKRSGGPSEGKADLLFAREVAGGKLCWKYSGKKIIDTAVAVTDGHMYLAEGGVTEKQRRAAADGNPQGRDVRLVTALDARSGKKIWQRPVDLTGCCGGLHWTSLGASCRGGVLVLYGIYVNGHHWGEFFSGKFEPRRIVALSAEDGSVKWEKHIGYRVRPVVVGDTLHAEPWAYDLQTGKQKMRTHPLTGESAPWQYARPGHHCGPPAAARNMLLFRSATFGYYDLDMDVGTMHFCSLRPGCWMNFIPANGLLTLPEASSGCMCSYSNQTTIAFQRRERKRAWGWFSQPGDKKPIRHLRVNFGAPGDRRDGGECLWLGYPRPSGHLVFELPLEVSRHGGGRYEEHAPNMVEVGGTDRPWLFRQGIRGLKRCTVPLRDKDDGRAKYTVRLAFAELSGEDGGPVPFDISLQEKTVAKEVNVPAEAGGTDRAAVFEFEGIEVGSELDIAFELRGEDVRPTGMPLLCGLEVVRGD